MFIHMSAEIISVDMYVGVYECIVENMGRRVGVSQVFSGQTEAD